MSLERLVGEWRMEVKFPNGVSGTGRMTFEWDVGAAFLLQRSKADAEGPPESLCLIGAEGDGYIQHYFDSRGVVRRYAMTLDGDAWTLERDGEQRFVGHFEDDDTIRGAWQWFRDGAWQHDFELVYRRSVAP